MTHVLVTGAGGFIGGHLVDRLLRQGHRVRAVDQKDFRHWYQVHDDAESVSVYSSSASEADWLSGTATPPARQTPH